MKKIIFSGVVAPFVLLTCLTSVVQATSYNYSYTWNSGGMLSGTLEGTLQGDNNTVVVTSITGSYTPGNGPAPFDLTHSGAFWFTGIPIVTLNGSAFDLHTGTNVFQNVEFLITSTFNSAQLWNPPTSNINGTIPLENEGIDPSPQANSWVAADHWSITEVPEPTTIVLFGTSMLGLLAWAHRKKKSATS